MSNVQLAPDLCRRCGGRCCRETPGVWVDPHRFLALFDLPRPAIPADLDLAPLGLEWRDLGGVAVPLPQSDDTGCRRLGPDGCRFSVAERPCQCLALIPDAATLAEDELLCPLPDPFRLVEARRRWAAVWGIAVPSPPAP